jgi:hypothetical protein
VSDLLANKSVTPNLKKRGQSNRWKPVLDLCNTIHNTAAMRTSPTAARALTVIDRPFKDEMRYISLRMSDDAGGAYLESSELFECFKL